MSESSSPDSTPQPQPATRTIRTFKNRASAELAVARLKDQGIEGTILELAPPPGRPALISEAVRLVVDSEDANKATRLLLNLSAEGGAGLPASGEARRKPRPVPRVKAGPPWLFILMALLGAGGAIFYAAWNFYGVKAKPKTEERPRERYVNEDTNHDGIIDQRRYLAASGELLRDEVDKDFDGKPDVRTLYDRGRLKRRSVDLDKNGIMDEDTFYDRFGRPFYSQEVMNGKGPVTKRVFYQEAVEFPDWEPTAEDPGPTTDATQPGGGDSWPFRVLLDTNADGHFDLDQKLNLKREVVEEIKLERGAPENNPPTFP